MNLSASGHGLGTGLLSLLGRHAHLVFPAAAGVLALYNTHILLGPELNRSGDNMYHLFNQYVMAHGIEAGDNPFGPLAMEFGQPVLRFYQALFYLYNVAVHLVTGWNLTSLHNFTVVVCFALSPFSYMYFLRKLGINRWAAAMGAFISLISIAAFGNSLEAYHQSGIVTQSMGGLFFPWFMGHFIGMLRGENRVSSTALLFALALLSHAVMSVFAMLAGALYFLVTSFEVRSVSRKLAGFAVIGLCLVAFWMLPFLDHTQEMRPIPDSIIRTDRHFWFASLSKDELARVLLSGRLLDDAKSMGKDRDSDDVLMDKINIMGTLRTRDPIMSIMTAVGFLTAVLGLRRASRRFLLGGFIFSLMFFAGADDFPWLNLVPFMKNIQVFRSTYLIEFFAFGLVAVAIETILLRWVAFAWRRRFLLKVPLTVAWLVATGFVVGISGREIVLLGETHLHTRDPGYLDSMIDACSTLPHSGRPFRITAIYPDRYKIRQAWFGINRSIPYCTHWKGTGPSAAYHLCLILFNTSGFDDLGTLAGVRYLSASPYRDNHLMRVRDRDGDPLFERLPNGRRRDGGSTDWHTLLDTGREHYLRPMAGKPLPVVCSDAQWIWLVKSWTERYGRVIPRMRTPVPMRVRAGALARSGLMERALAVLYLDQSALELDREALERFENQGGRVVSPLDIKGLHVEESGHGSVIWEHLPSAMIPIVDKKRRMEIYREEQNPAFEIATVDQLERGHESAQWFAFDIDLLEPAVVILPMEAVPGWTATLDGEPYPIFPTGPDMVGAYLPEGAHRLLFRWEMSRSEWLTLALSLAALVALIGFWLRGAWLRLVER